MQSRFEFAKRFLQVKDGEDERPVSRWKGPDILPVLPKNRTFVTSDYASYWYVYEIYDLLAQP